uniref:Tumor necrosis factor-inducible gene 6 protein n=1 Tax=Oreochromis niloticus TaxID=8128 RepID=A0A669CXL1_ORENI
LCYVESPVFISVYRESQGLDFLFCSLSLTEQAAGVYHRESRKGRYQLTYKEAKAVCKYEGGTLATYEQLEAARQIGFHVCAAGWFDKGRVGYPIVKPGSNCGFGKVGIIDYGYRLNKSERWDVYCYNPNSKECGGVLTEQQKIIQSPGFPEEYEDEQICYWHIRVRLGQKIRLHFMEFDVEDDTECLADYLEVYDSYDDVSGFAGRFCGDYLPDDIISTGESPHIFTSKEHKETFGFTAIQNICL